MTRIKVALLITALSVPSLALGQTWIDGVTLPLNSILTNAATFAVTSSVPVEGKALTVTISGTNVFAQVDTKSGAGTSLNAAKAIMPSTLIPSAGWQTNIAASVYLKGDYIILSATGAVAGGSQNIKAFITVDRDP